jgi:hypothetical protein
MVVMEGWHWDEASHNMSSWVGQKPIQEKWMLENVHHSSKNFHIWLGRLLPLSVLSLLTGLAHWISPMLGDDKLPP